MASRGPTTLVPIQLNENQLLETALNFITSLRKRPESLWVLFALQSFCAVFFLGEGVAEEFGVSTDIIGLDHEIFESVLALALIASLAFTGMEIRDLRNRQKEMESQLKAASGEFAGLLNDHFEQWSLTKSERDVALLVIKGFSIAEIARIRETKEGTIKSQSNAIYRKAGVTGRTQLVSMFIEELMANVLATSSNAGSATTGSEKETSPA